MEGSILFYCKYYVQSLDSERKKGVSTESQRVNMVNETALGFVKQVCLEAHRKKEIGMIQDYGIVGYLFKKKNRYLWVVD